MEVDTTKPSPSRIYDYWLGGNHNFEADRQAADRLLQSVPSAKNAALLNRWFLHAVVQQLVDGGFPHYLDLASGLPTQGYIHELAPAAKVFYCDIDPVTVQFANQIIGDNPQVRFIQGNIKDIDRVLTEADAHFGGSQKTAISFIGSTYFFNDDDLQRMLDRLFDWCAPGSQLAASWVVGDDERFQRSAAGKMYAMMGSPVYLRTEEQVRALLHRWQLNDAVLRPLSQWSDMPDWRVGGMQDGDINDGELYGVVVTKP